MADNSYHGTMSLLSACSRHIGRLYMEWYMYLCGYDPVVFGSLILSCSLLDQTFALLCSRSVDWLAGLGVLSWGWWIDRCLENKIKWVVYSTSKI